MDISIAHPDQHDMAAIGEIALSDRHNNTFALCKRCYDLIQVLRAFHFEAPVLPAELKEAPTSTAVSRSALPLQSQIAKIRRRNRLIEAVINIVRHGCRRASAGLDRLFGIIHGRIPFLTPARIELLEVHRFLRHDLIQHSIGFRPRNTIRTQSVFCLKEFERRKRFFPEYPVDRKSQLCL